jgi:hypothetical protein
VFAKLRPVWRNIMRTDSSGLILVMDNHSSAASIATARRELLRFVSFDGAKDDDNGAEAVEQEEDEVEERPLAVTTVPLLIFLCDAAQAAATPVLTAAQVAHEFELTTRMRGRKWCVRHVSPDTLQGIAEGLDWLASNM